MNRNTIIQTLLAKQALPLENHLQEAIRNGQIQQQYVSFPGKKKNENSQEFANRVTKASERFQFVQVLFNGENHYVAFGTSGPIITKFGRFSLVPGQVVGGRWGVHYFLFSPNFETALQQKEIFIRLDSGCVSGQVFNDITCDCREQFEIALRICARDGAGIVVHIPGHDGRGWAQFKLANQQLMDECDLDTVAAARLFYGDELHIDQRTYMESVIILRAFGFGERHIFNMATNNPRKVGAFVALGMNLKGSQSIVAQQVNPLLEANLKAKSEKWNHNFNNTVKNQKA